jgi:hypothetical protein
MKHLKHLQKHLKPLQIHTQHLDKTLANICVKHMQHPDKHICNIRLKTQMKHWEQKLATYVDNHYNICNISIYFCNIHMKHLQHTSETYETDTCNMRFHGDHISRIYRAVFSFQIWSAKIHCSDTVAFRLYLVIIVQPLTN